MEKIMKLKYVIFLLVIFSCNAPYTKNYPTLIEDFMLSQVSENDFNGNVLVAKEGKIIYKKSFGYADFDTKRLLNDSSVFELASVSKQFIAMGVLLLVQKRKIKLSDTLRQFFPQLPYHHITIKNLLTHTSGLPDADREMALKWNHKKIAFNKDVIHFLATEKPPIHFQPGSQWEYSNTAFVLLASLIEKVSGQSFRDFMAENIFKPLGMTHSEVCNTRRSLKEIIPDYAYGYVYSDSLKKYVLPDSLPEFDEVYYLDGLEGPGAVNSTTGDLLKWENALKAHLLLDENLQKEMLSPQSLTDTILKKYYGYGVFLGNNAHGKYASHRGGWPGYGTFLLHYEFDDITIVVLCNNVATGAKPEYIYSKGLANILFGKSDTPVHRAVEINPLLAKRYVGKYRASQPFELIQKKGRLFQRENGTPDIELKPKSVTTFLYPGGDKQIDFWVTPWGEVEKAFLILNGKRTEIKNELHGGTSSSWYR